MPEIPIQSITNGVHTQTWLSDEFASLYSRYLGANWSDKPADHKMWERVNQDSRCGAVALARTAARAPGRVRARPPAQQFGRRGASPANSARIDEILDPEALTIGFARRFATYKRATLLFRNQERLIKLLTDRDQPAAVYLRRQIAPARRRRQALHPGHHCSSAKREDVPHAHGLHRRLRHERRPLPGAGRGRVAEHAAPADGSLRHLGHERPDQRRHQPLDPRRLVGGMLPQTIRSPAGPSAAKQEYNNDEFQDHIDSESLFDLLEKEVVPRVLRPRRRRPAAAVDRPHEAVHPVRLLLLQLQPPGAGIF